MVSFTYTVTGPNSTVATGLVSVTTIPCFVAETMILTAEGERPFEALQPDESVMTKGDGPQITKMLEPAMIAEIHSIFPEIDPLTSQGYNLAAHRRLKGDETQLLLSAAMAA